LIVVNLGTLLFMNRPRWVLRAEAALAPRVSPRVAERIRFGGFLVHHYAHLVGLDNRWEMFNHFARFNWLYLIKGVYQDGAIVVLPLSRQSPRTFWDWLLFDLKEGKFQHNILHNQTAKAAYARYLCRAYPTHQGVPIAAIRWEFRLQKLNPPAEAARRGAPGEPYSPAHLLHAFSCPTTGSGS